MSTNNVAGLIDNKKQRDTERRFLDLIERNIQVSTGNVGPIPSSLFDRCEAIKACYPREGVRAMSLKKNSSKVGAFVAGMGSAFALFPSGHLDSFIHRESISSRMYSNFRRAGDNLRVSMETIRHEQKNKPRSAPG